MDLAASTAVAAAQTFGTNELLEHIFTSLGLVDLVSAQRVNRQWRDVIAGSKKLRPNLFLTAVPCKAYLYWKQPPRDQEHGPYITPTLLPDRPCYTITQPHPAFRNDHFNNFGFDMCISVSCAELIRWHAGLLKEMFITQPPCPKVTVCFDVNFSWADTQTVIRDIQGIRFGALVAGVVELATEQRAKLRARGLDEKSKERELDLEWVYVRIDGFLREESRYVRIARRRDG